MIFNKNECNYLDLTRFIGIFLVVLGHITLIYTRGFVTDMIFTFHMPLFFIVSGLLHKQKEVNLKNIADLGYSLLVPLLIYNLFAIICNLFYHGTSFINEKFITSVLTGQYFPSLPTWFLLSLFLVKLISLYIESQKVLAIISITGLIYLYIDKKYGLNCPNYFTFKSVLFSLPFWVIGIWANKHIKSIPLSIRLIIVILAIPISYLSLTYFPRISIAEVYFSNLFINIIVAVVCSFAVLFFTQFVNPYLKCSFIKDISRGTMIILSTHMVFFYTILSAYFWQAQSLRNALLKTIIAFVFYYLIIKLTYNRLPILYGKRKQHKK